MTQLRHFLLVLVLLHAAVAAPAEVVRTDHVESELVAEVAAIEPGRPFTVGLRMRMDEHWHTYWVNPGDSGLGTTIDWTLPEGFTAGPIQWPAPKRIPTPPLMTYGYEGEILLMVEITPPPTLERGASVEIAAHAEWLVCELICIPGEGRYSLRLPVAEGPARPDAARAAEFAAARERLPRAAEWGATFTRSGGAYLLRFNPPAGREFDPAEAYFFALDELVVEPAAPQSATFAGGVATMRIPRAETAEGEPEALRGVLVADGAWTIAAPRGGPSATGAATTADEGRPLALLLALAFAGGFILNLMPCVFPVLGIKILGFVNQAGADRRKVTLHGLVFTLGVLVSFWALAGLLIALRAGGQELGWGFQLQSPAFVFGVAVFLLVFALNLAGLFEFGLSATGVGGSLQMRDGFAGSFFTGVLATIVATPCSAPFLAPALGAALALPAAGSLLVFTAIALGLALPYLVLSFAPGLVKWLPRPGAWMETFKQLMSFPLFATVGALVWVLAGQVPETGLLKVLLALVLVSMAAWAYGRWVQRVGGPRVAGLVFTLAAAAGGLWLGYPAKPSPTDVVWEKWSQAEVERLLAEDRLVYVDFTARWCATCQSNKALVFGSAAVRERFRELGVATLKADWTNRDPEITRALAAFGRGAVPFNLLYAPGASEPVVLPEVLTPEIVLEALSRAGAPLVSRAR